MIDVGMQLLRRQPAPPSHRVGPSNAELWKAKAYWLKGLHGKLYP
jgi:hypothetical protein